MCRSYSKYNTSTSRAVVYFMATGLQCDRVICEGKKNTFATDLSLFYTTDIQNEKTSFKRVCYSTVTRSNRVKEKGFKIFSKCLLKKVLMRL